MNKPSSASTTSTGSSCQPLSQPPAAVQPMSAKGPIPLPKPGPQKLLSPANKAPVVPANKAPVPVLIGKLPTPAPAAGAKSVSPPPPGAPVGQSINAPVVPPPDPSGWTVESLVAYYATVMQDPSAVPSIPDRLDRSSPEFFKALATIRSPKFRAVDSFNNAVKAFAQQLRVELKEQSERPNFKKFTWKNSGALAENFATLCDQTKKLHDYFKRLEPQKIPSFEVFSGAMLDFLVQRHEAHIPQSTLSRKTYSIKFKDWQVGGTRYSSGSRGGGEVANVEFADVDVREGKLLNIMVESLNMSSQIAGGRNVQDSASRLKQLLASSSSKRVELTSTGNIVRRPIQIRNTPCAKKSGGGSTGSANLGGGGVVAQEVAQAEKLLARKRREENERFQLSLKEIVGGDLRVFPNDRIDRMPQFVVLCRNAPHQGLADNAFKILSSASEKAKKAFVNAGGFLAVMQWMEHAMADRDEQHMKMILFRLRNFRGIGKLPLETEEAWKQGPAFLKEAATSPPPQPTPMASVTLLSSAPLKNTTVTSRQLDWLRSFKWATEDPIQMLLIIKEIEAFFSFCNTVVSSNLKEVGRPQPGDGPAAKKHQPEVSSRKDERPTQTVASIVRKDDVLFQRIFEKVRHQENAFDSVEPPLPDADVPCLCCRALDPSPAFIATFDPFKLLGVRSE